MIFLEYIDQINKFRVWQRCHPLTSSQISLWYALIGLSNDLGGEKEISVAISTLEIETGLKKTAICQARNKLSQVGLIKWKKQNKNQSSVYELVFV